MTSPNLISTLHRRFTCVRLPQPYLPGSCPGVSATLTTMVLAIAACGGLRSAHDCRPRRALLHHSHSWASPIRRRRFRVTRRTAEAGDGGNWRIRFCCKSRRTAGRSRPANPLRGRRLAEASHAGAHNRKSPDDNWTMPTISISRSAMRSPLTSPLMTVRSFAVPTWSKVW